MTKLWPRNTRCSTPVWASKARAQASPLPVNTGQTAVYWALPGHHSAASPGTGQGEKIVWPPKGQVGNIWKLRLSGLCSQGGR